MLYVRAKDRIASQSGKWFCFASSTIGTVILISKFFHVWFYRFTKQTVKPWTRLFFSENWNKKTCGSFFWHLHRLVIDFANCSRGRNVEELTNWIFRPLTASSSQRFTFQTFANPINALLRETLAYILMKQSIFMAASMINMKLATDLLSCICYQPLPLHLIIVELVKI